MSFDSDDIDRVASEIASSTPDPHRLLEIVARALLSAAAGDAEIAALVRAAAGISEPVPVTAEPAEESADADDPWGPGTHASPPSYGSDPGGGISYTTHGSGGGRND